MKGIAKVYIAAAVMFVIVTAYVMSPRPESAATTATTMKATTTTLAALGAGASENAVRALVGSGYTVIAEGPLANGKTLVYAYGEDTRIFAVGSGGTAEEIELDDEE